MDLGLSGKSVLITGGSKGIGLACARVFAAEGCRIHLAARDTGVRVLGVHLPSTRTDRILNLLKAAARGKFGDENRYEEMIGTGTFGPLVEPEQVANTVAFLASPRAGELSGVVLNLET